MRKLDEAAFRKYAGWFADDTDEPLLRWMQPPTDQWFTYVTTTTGVYAWGFYLDGILVGMMQIDTIAVRTGAIGIVVNKAFRNRGVGRKILALIFHEARALGMQRMIAEAEPENVSSLRCLTAAGFVQDSPVSNEDGYLCFSRNL